MIGTAIAFLAVSTLAVGALAFPYTNTQAAEEDLPYETVEVAPQVVGVAATTSIEPTVSAEAAERELYQINGIVEAVQGQELTIQLMFSEVMECGLYELVGITEDRQIVLTNENTVFEVAAVVRGELADTRSGGFADISPDGLHQSLSVYGQERDGVFLAEKIIIWTFEW